MNDLAARIGENWHEQLTAWRAEPKPLIIIPDRWGGFFGRWTPSPCAG